MSDLPTPNPPKTNSPTPCPFAPWDDPNSKPLVSIRQLTKNFGNFIAIDQINLDIFPREFFALLGPSGCGKTTLMRMLAGFETPNSGDILLQNKSLVAVPAHRRPVNMMFQSYALFPHMTVADNIAFGLKQDPPEIRLNRDQIAQRVDSMLQLVQLTKFAYRKPHQLSGGQRQRVALARTLAKKPQLVLLDEPLGALDKKLRQETQFELMDIQEKLGLTFVIVTHDQEEAMTVSSRIAVMNEGKIAQVDTPHGIYETPNSVYVADFIGDINLIRGYIVPHNTAQHQLHWADNQPPLLVNTETLDITSDKIVATLTLRPEKISITHEEPADEASFCKLQGKVIDIAYTGSLSVYHVEIPQGIILKVQEANNRRVALRRFTWEDHVWVHWRISAGRVLTN